MKKPQMISYSLLAFCLAFVGLPIYIYLPNYYYNNFNISLKNISIILLYTRLVDAIQDPIFGILSDRFYNYKKKIIFFCTPLLGLCFLLLFYPLFNVSINLWLSFFLILTYTFFSIIYINYQSYPANVTSNYENKTKIIAYREFFFVLGIIFASVSPNILNKFYSPQKSFLIIGVVYTVLIVVFGWIFYKFSPPQQLLCKSNVSQKQNFMDSIKATFSLFKNKAIKNYFIIFSLNSFSSAIPASLIMFFIEKYLKLPQLTWLFLLLYFLGLLIGVPLWAKISFILKNKIMAWFWSGVATIAVFSLCLFVKQGSFVLYGLVCFFSGVSFGGDLSIGYSHLTDIIQESKIFNKESTIFGMINFILKLALTLSASVLIYFIGFYDFNFYLQSQFIFLTYILLPLVLRISSLFVLYKKCIKKS